MSKYLPGFDELARQRGVRRCRGIQPNGQQCFRNHNKGETTLWQDQLVIHWADRRTSRQGIRHFLYQIALGELRDVEPAWRRRYRALRSTVKYLQQARVRVAADDWFADKTRLKTALLMVPTTDPEREEAMTWAKSG